MSFTKFVSLLESQALYFCRSDKFEDPFEGTVPEHVPREMEAFFEEKVDNAKELAADMVRLQEQLRLFTFVNCWHQNDGESDAMWKLYSLTHEGIAVKSTVGRLRACLNKSDTQVFFGSVQYVEMSQADPAIFFNAITPFIYKRKSFEHEREIRALIWIGDHEKTTDEQEIVDLVPSEEGKLVTVDLNELIEAVVISPLAPKWYKNLVESMVRRFNLFTQVYQSSLYEMPERRRLSKSEAIAVPEIFRDMLNYLQEEHLRFMELQAKERERVANREYEMFLKVFEEISEEIDKLVYSRDGESQYTGKAVFREFVKDTSDFDAERMFREPICQSAYFYSGRIDNLLRDIGQSSLAEKEKLLLIRRVVFLYTESICFVAANFAAKAQLKDDWADDEWDNALMLMAENYHRMFSIMRELII
jgi:hypothetical protein